MAGEAQQNTVIPRSIRVRDRAKIVYQKDDQTQAARITVNGQAISTKDGFVSSESSTTFITEDYLTLRGKVIIDADTKDDSLLFPISKASEATIQSKDGVFTVDFKGKSFQLSGMERLGVYDGTGATEISLRELNNMDSIKLSDLMKTRNQRNYKVNMF